MSNHLNYFAEGEQGKMAAFSQWRTNILRPVTNLLTKLHITPNQVSALSLFSTFGFVAFADTKPMVSMLFIGLHVALDGLDGSLARAQKNDSNQGAFVDICVDQTGLAIIVLVLIYNGFLPGFLGAWYLVSYIVQIAFLVVLNALNNPVGFTIRTKYILYLLMLVYVLTVRNFIEPFLWLASSYATVASIILFNRIRCSL